MGECCSRLLGTIVGALDVEIWIQSIDNSNGWCVCEIRNRTSARVSGAREWGRNAVLYEDGLTRRVEATAIKEGHGV